MIIATSKTNVYDCSQQKIAQLSVLGIEAHPLSPKERLPPYESKLETYDLLLKMIGKIKTHSDRASQKRLQTRV